MCPTGSSLRKEVRTLPWVASSLATLNGACVGKPDEEMDSGPVSQNQGVVGLRVVCLRVAGGSEDTWLVFGSLHV